MQIANYKLLMRNDNNQKEKALLIACCKCAIFEELFDISIFKIQTINWSKLLELATYHKVRPLLYKGIIAMKLQSSIPELVFNQLKQKAIQLLFRNLQNAKELAKITKQFKERGIEIIPYKGIILSELAFNDLGCRESIDIDFLIKSKDLKTIGEILEEDGYQTEMSIPKILKPLFFHLYEEYNYDLFDKDGTRKFHVEPHFRIGSKMYQTDFDYDKIKPFINKQNFIGTPMNILSPEGILLTTCMHHGGSPDTWQQIKHVADIAAIVHQFKSVINWEELFFHTQQFKITNVVLIGLGISHQLFNCFLPNVVLEKIAAQNLTDFISERIQFLTNQEEHEHYSKAFLSRIIYYIKTREYVSTKLKIVWYHFIHLFFKNFIRYKHFS